MDNQEHHCSADYECQEDWDFERAERRPGVKTTRAIVSVAFPREEFDLVATEAERRGMKTSAFIRKLALAGSKPAAAIVSTTSSARLKVMPAAPENWTTA
jgi:hypothetical protein